MHRQVLMFGIVGSLAALVHFMTVSQLVPLGMQPLIANLVGFMTAVSVSFIGHNILTFPSSERSHLPALGRFLTVATLAFACNELLYWVLLRFTALSYRPALVIVLVVVAAGTFALSKFWAFNDG